MKREIMIGNKYNRLTVIKKGGRKNYKQQYICKKIIFK